MPEFTSFVKPKSSALTTSNLRLDTYSLKDGQFNAQKLFGVCSEILKKLVQFAGSAVERIVQLWVNQQLTDGALPRVDLVKSNVDLDESIGHLAGNFIVFEQ